MKVVINMKQIRNQIFDEERALYNLEDSLLTDVKFRGPRDGESCLKEARNIIVDNTLFDLRYPMWHVLNFRLADSNFSSNARAPIWYSTNGEILNIVLNAIKGIRECTNIKIADSTIFSNEFGWKCDNISVKNSNLESEYVFLDSKNIHLNNVNFIGKYSFQYVKDADIVNSNLYTKDAFWHSENVTVRDSYLQGEYLGWYSKNLTLINCKINGHQPLCYAENLTLIDCEFENSDLAFEKSDVNGNVYGDITSIKSPKSGKLIVKGKTDIIKEHELGESKFEIIFEE